MSQSEYYLCTNVHEDTWQNFTRKYHKGPVDADYTRLTEYPWNATFAFNPDGKAVYIDGDGKMHRGYWFTISNTTIAIFERN